MPPSAVVPEQGAGVRYAVLVKRTEAKVKLCEGFLNFVSFYGAQGRTCSHFLKNRRL